MAYYILPSVQVDDYISCLLITPLSFKEEWRRPHRIFRCCVVDAGDHVRSLVPGYVLVIDIANNAMHVRTILLFKINLLATVTPHCC